MRFIFMLPAASAGSMSSSLIRARTRGLVQQRTAALRATLHAHGAVAQQQPCFGVGCPHRGSCIHYQEVETAQEGASWRSSCRPGESDQFPDYLGTATPTPARGAQR